MDFIRRNWMKLSLAALSLTGLVFMLVNIFSIGQLPNEPEFLDIRPDFMGLALTIGYVMFFAGVFCYLVLQMLEMSKRFLACWLLGVGAVVTTFMILGLVNAVSTWDETFEAWRIGMSQFEGQAAQVDNRWAKFVVFPVVAQLIVVGLFPLVLGVRNLIKSFGNRNQA